MKQRKYQNFDLDFYHVENILHVKARSLAGEARHPFRLPCTNDDARQFTSRLEKSLFGHQLDHDDVKKFGGNLFAAVFQEEVRALFKSSLALARVQGNDGLRLRLHLQDVPALAYLPWEFLYEASTNQFLCLDHQTPLVRYLDTTKAVVPLQTNLPLRILVMISSPTPLLYLNVDEERAKLQKALADFEKRGLIEIHWLEVATVAELQKTLRSSFFHIFHFIGHGDFEAETKQGWLAFEDDEESVARVNAEQLAAILNNHPSLRLIVLNSCAGAKTTPTNPFASTAATLVQKGIPAVVAMQFPISDTAAVKFAEEFYAAVADGVPVEVAMTEARVALFSSGNRFEWGTPVFFMRASDGALFDWKGVDSGGKFKTGIKEHSRPDESATTPPVSKKPFRKTAVIYALATILFATITFLILAVLPRSTSVDIEVFAQYVSFSLSEENEEKEISLLYSNLLTNTITIERFQPLNLLLDSLSNLGVKVNFDNPILITPHSQAARITFSAYSTPTSFDPYIGYYFYNDPKNSRPSLKIPYALLFSSSSAAEYVDPAKWLVNIMLSSGDFVEKITSFGVATEANAGLDRLDFRKPPAIAATPTVEFKRPKWDANHSAFATDIRPEIGESEIWEFDVRASSRQPARLTFTGIQRIPAHFEVYLIDEGRAQSANLSEDSLYRFTPAAELAKFKVVVGKKEKVQEQISSLTLPQEFALGHNYPNPFNPTTAIPVAVPAASEIKLKIYNLLGVEVRTLYDGSIEAGRYWFNWDGRNDLGSQVATGVYLYRLTTNKGVVLVDKMILLR